MRIMLCAAAAAQLLGIPAAAARPGRSSVLTAVADIGTVYWRYDCSRSRPVRFALGVRIFYTATTEVVFRAGRLESRRTLQPRQTFWFPLLRASTQKLSFDQWTEPGRLRATVEVDWRGNHCASYFPPRFTVQLYPR